MEDIKLICTDIDGTLLNSNHQINELDKLMIQRAWREKNIPIALVSGRFKGGLTFIQEELDVPCIYSSFNGCYVEWQNKVIHEERITLEELRKVIPVINNTGSTPQIFDLFDYFFNEENHWSKEQIKRCGYPGIIGDLNKQIDKWEKENFTPFKILAKNGNPELLEKTRQALIALNIDTLSIVQSASFIVEISPSSANKGSTINLLADYFNIKTNQVMAFGDYNNDIEMLKQAGYSFAMGNASDEIKKIAKFETETNDNCGIAIAINKYIFDNKYSI